MKIFKDLNFLKVFKRTFSVSTVRNLQFNEEHRALQATVAKVNLKL